MNNVDQEVDTQQKINNPENIFRIRIKDKWRYKFVCHFLRRSNCSHIQKLYNTLPLRIENCGRGRGGILRA